MLERLAADTGVIAYLMAAVGMLAYWPRPSISSPFTGS